MHDSQLTQSFHFTFDDNYPIFRNNVNFNFKIITIQHTRTRASTKDEKKEKLVKGVE